jgi:arginine-tRNA-protein transferase
VSSNDAGEERVAVATRVVQDRFEECVYLPGQVARCPARVPLQRLAPEELDYLLEQGDQRVGGTVFRTECPFCSACEPVRVDVAQFRPSRSQRRVLARNDGIIRVEFGDPSLSRRRVALWNRHRRVRGLLTEHSRRDPVGYREWLVDTCADTREVRYYNTDKLVALSLLDVGRTSANSAYHFFDTRESQRSLGVYSVLHEIAWCAEQGIRWYYLGLWVRDCRALRYKTSYHPHERLIGGEWERFEAGD